MRKLLCSLTILALTLAAVSGFAASKNLVLKPNVTYKYVPRTTSGKPITTIFKAQHEPASMAKFKAQNHLSYAVNQKILSKAKTAKKGGFVNGTIDTVPYFQSWFITGSRNSIYPYSMVGQSPTNGGTTAINTQIIPMITVLLNNGKAVAVYDPTVPNDPEGPAVDPVTPSNGLMVQSPLYDTSTTYPGPPSDKGQFNDTMQRNEFNTWGNWHTQLVPTSSGIVWIQFLEYLNGDWGFACCDSNGNNFPVVNIDIISNNFAFLLNVEVPANTTVPVIVTDYLTAFFPPDPNNCCVGGYHTAQTGIQDPSGILVWTWATYIAHSENNPFGSFASDIDALSHEIAELINDPFINTNVSPWVDGSVSFAQANLETGDAIEAMSDADAIYPVPLNTAGGPYIYNLQNEATLSWFTRNPFNGGIYSWPNEHTLSQSPHPVGCTAPQPSPNLPSPCWHYGQGSAAFLFGPPY